MIWARCDCWDCCVSQSLEMALCRDHPAGHLMPSHNRHSLLFGFSEVLLLTILMLIFLKCTISHSKFTEFGVSGHQHSKDDLNLH